MRLSELIEMGRTARPDEWTMDELTRNERDLIVLEDREFGAVGKVKLAWSKFTGAFTER